MSRHNAIRYAVIATVIFLLDRLTKLVALSWCARSVYVTPFLSCSVVFNRGIVWGFLNTNSALIFSALTMFIMVVIGLLFAHIIVRYRQGLPVGGEILIFSAACSNLLDRFLYAGVIDFIHISYGWFSWPLFNVADIAILFGIAWLLYLPEKR